MHFIVDFVSLVRNEPAFLVIIVAVCILFLIWIRDSVYARLEHTICEDLQPRVVLSASRFVVGKDCEFTVLVHPRRKVTVNRIVAELYCEVVEDHGYYSSITLGPIRIGWKGIYDPREDYEVEVVYKSTLQVCGLKSFYGGETYELPGALTIDPLGVGTKKEGSLRRTWWLVVKFEVPLWFKFKLTKEIKEEVDVRRW